MTEVCNIFQTYFRNVEMPWLKILNQDEAKSPDFDFAWVRELFVAPGVKPGCLNFTVTLYKSEPREMPPVHMGDAGGGLMLTRDQVKEVVAACLMFLHATDPEISS